MSSDELKLPLPSLGDFVEFHRKRLGLTREQLGKRAFLSARTIQKLERGEQTGLSQPTQESLGRALGLTTPVEFRHLDDLTRVHIPRPWLTEGMRTEVTAAERAMLDDLMPRPAAYCNWAWEVIAANDAYERLFPGRVAAANLAYWLFGPIGREIMMDWPTESANVVARMRSIMAYFGNPEIGLSLLRGLQDDRDFARLWLTRCVGMDRGVDEPQYVWTDAGPVGVTMQLQSLPATRESLHLCVAVVRPYTGPIPRVDPI
ncbi:helix-turn-helix domain-containing protein [Nocardia sp. CDC160]|uniref:helix-turn-helix domain-containing protein n=1 Tax=Nocardia sp. CDC160 TaxID=3112166 RepID=UPI002DBBF61A|nr:helix-turn-helix domain-containing protein [Nocardia sp. CDC160]MEC3916216.1 helix-turn-helix domain-containing protein [Nocardia sp. CDC160]